MSVAEDLKLERPRARRDRRRATPYVLAAAAVGVVLLSSGYPLVRQFVMAFQEFTLAQQFGADPAWVGLENFRTALADPVTRAVVGRTLLFCFAASAGSIALGMTVASIMLRCSRWTRTVIQIVLLLVWAVPEMSALTVWRLLFEARFGLVNWLLVSIGADWATDFNWLGENGLLMLMVVVVIVVWKGAPFVAFITYAAYTQVPGEVLEAAQLDGAGTWQRFRHVVLPIIMPSLLLVSLLQIIWNLRQFTPIFVLQRSSGISLDASDVIGTYIYRLGIGQGNYGVASALAMMVLFLTLAVTSWNVRQTFVTDKESTA